MKKDYKKRFIIFTSILGIIVTGVKWINKKKKEGLEELGIYNGKNTF